MRGMGPRIDELRVRIDELRARINRMTGRIDKLRAGINGMGPITDAHFGVVHGRFIHSKHIHTP
jgi:hypothetical protein